MESDFERLQNLLKTKVLTVKFRKTDGSERVMKCTLRPDILDRDVPARTKTETKSDSGRNDKANPNVLIVWEIDKKQWRSFRVSSVFEVSEQIHGADDSVQVQMREE